jgi:hypothetical protein
MRGDRKKARLSDLTNVADGSKVFKKPTDYIGTNSLGAPAQYEAHAPAHVYDVKVPDCDLPGKVFVGQPAYEGGAWTQISRLGMPLVNEVVIGLPDKDLINASEPRDDAQFASYVTNPSLPELLEILFGGAGVVAPNRFPRTDLVAAFLTGVPNVNANGSTAELARLNTALLATPKGAQNSLGAAACRERCARARQPRLRPGRLSQRSPAW